MTSHELAHKLLQMPDLIVTVGRTSCCYEEYRQIGDITITEDSETKTQVITIKHSMDVFKV